MLLACTTKVKLHPIWFMAWFLSADLSQDFITALHLFIPYSYQSDSLTSLYLFIQSFTGLYLLTSLYLFIQSIYLLVCTYSYQFRFIYYRNIMHKKNQKKLDLSSIFTSIPYMVSFRLRSRQVWMYSGTTPIIKCKLVVKDRWFHGLVAQDKTNWAVCFAEMQQEQCGHRLLKGVVCTGGCVWKLSVRHFQVNDNYWFP